MTFEEWKDSYGLIYEQNYCEGTDFDCQAAFKAGAASRDAEIAELDSNCSNALNNQQREIDDLQALNAELVADATRYRVLANSIWYIGPESFYCGEGGDLYDFDNKNITKDILDAAVDALAKVRKP